MGKKIIICECDKWIFVLFLCIFGFLALVSLILFIIYLIRCCSYKKKLLENSEKDKKTENQFENLIANYTKAVKDLCAANEEKMDRVLCYVRRIECSMRTGKKKNK